MPANEPALSDSSFASFLARLAEPAAETAGIWNDDILGDDVVTPSYEDALRTHARVRTPSPPSLPDTNLPDSRQTLPAAASAPAKAVAGPTPFLTSLEESRKSSSVTIRLSHAERDRLHERAAAAGLTVSAYLRFCIFEVEALRSQVKDTLAQIRSRAAVETVPQQAKAEPAAPAAPVHRRLLFQRLRWLLFSRWTTGQRVAHA